MVPGDTSAVPSAHATPLEVEPQRSSATVKAHSPGVAPASLKRKRSAPLTPRRAGDLSAVLADLAGEPDLKGSTAEANGVEAGEISSHSFSTGSAPYCMAANKTSSCQMSDQRDTDMAA